MNFLKSFLNVGREENINHNRNAHDTGLNFATKHYANMF